MTIETLPCAIVPIDGLSALPAPAGGKALGLLRIVEAGLFVPRAWVLLPGAADGDLDTLAAHLRDSGVARVAVRSSAPEEDGCHHSFAGIHETALGVPVPRLRETIPAVASSVLSPRAQSYRRQHGLDPAAFPCAVVVQEMFDAEWSGVAFGRGDGILVEAVEGLGEVAVNGDATPEAIELRRDDAAYRIVRRWPRRQREALRSGPDGLVRVTLRGLHPECPATIVADVVAGVAALERARGACLDVEWAARDGRVAFLQARPQTRPLAETLPPGETWTRANVSETLSEVTSAIARAAAVGHLDRLVHDVYSRIGLPLPSGLPLAAAVAGRVVFNERAMCHVVDTLGVPRAWVQVLMGGAGAGSNAYLRPDPRKLMRRLDVLVRLSLFALGAERRARAHVLNLRARYAARAMTDLVRLDDDAVHRTASMWGNEIHASLVEVMRVGFAFQQTVSAGCVALATHAAPAALLARLLDPELASVSTQQVEDLVELARALRAWGGARAFLCEIGPEHACDALWRETLPAALWNRARDWLDRYGHRGPFESDAAEPRYADDLRLLAAALRPLVVANEEPEAAVVRRARRRADAAAAWREVATVHGCLGRLRVGGPARRLGRLMLVREDLRSAMMLHHHLTRRAVLELGRRFAARGRLDAAEDVFHLDLGELERAVRDPALDVRAAVARERARVAAWRRIEVPTVFRSEDVARFPRRGAPAPGTDTILQGTAVSPGEVMGLACVLRSPQDEAKMRTGGILVAPTTDPGWSPVFARAAGVVVEMGGVMSHAGTVAREYGLPCVSNVDGATWRVRDGDLLQVDGTTGRIEILERAPA